MPGAETQIMQLVADDPINRSIWTDSVALQQKIVEYETLPLQVGAQQAMPKACDERLSSASDPLPWVPDLVGTNFGDDPNSLLVVASSYNGFVANYSGRGAVMPLADYVDAKKAGVDGLGRFLTRFKECVVDRDKDYYQPIQRDLLTASGCVLDDCCITDLCKASFVQRGDGPHGGNRDDKGKDSVLEEFWPRWTPYVVGLTDGGVDAPLPYQWLWRRMQMCRFVLALGKIAEYGVLKIFNHMATAPTAWSKNKTSVIPDHPSMTPIVNDWEYGYACSQRSIGKWLTQEDWWVLGDSGSEARWFMLPVYHPAAAFQYEWDIHYKKTAPRVKRMVATSPPSTAAFTPYGKRTI